MSMVLNGLKPISQKVINGLASGYPMVNTHWLLTGEGEMFLGSEVIRSGGNEPEVKEEGARYEPIGIGILESLVRRVARLEDEVEGLREEVRGLKKDDCKP